MDLHVGRVTLSSWCSRKGTNSARTCKSDLNGKPESATFGFATSVLVQVVSVRVGVVGESDPLALLDRSEKNENERPRGLVGDMDMIEVMIGSCMGPTTGGERVAFGRFPNRFSMFKRWGECLR